MTDHDSLLFLSGFAIGIIPAYLLVGYLFFKMDNLKGWWRWWRRK